MLLKLASVTFLTQGLFLVSDLGRSSKTNFLFTKSNVPFLNSRGHFDEFEHKKSRHLKMPAYLLSYEKVSIRFS